VHRTRHSTLRHGSDHALVHHDQRMAELEAENGDSVGFHRVGGVRVAASEAREKDLVSMDALLLEHGSSPDVLLMLGRAQPSAEDD